MRIQDKTSSAVYFRVENKTFSQLPIQEKKNLDANWNIKNWRIQENAIKTNKLQMHLDCGKMEMLNCLRIVDSARKNGFKS